MKHIKQILALSLSALVGISAINMQGVDHNNSMFQSDIKILISKDAQDSVQLKHISAGQSVLNFVQILTTSALVGGLCAASGSLCSKYERKYFADSPKLAFIIVCLWGLAEQAVRMGLAEQLSAKGIAVSSVLNACIGRLASWSAYLGYCDNYMYGSYAKNLTHADAMHALNTLADICQNNIG